MFERSRSAVLVVVLLLGGGTHPASALGVHAALSPANVAVGSGDEFDLNVVVPDTSASFNAFEIAVEFDPGSLTLVSYQEGALMTGACGNRFHVPATGTGSFTVTDGLLCAGTKVHGPGTVYSLRFRADADGVITTVIFRRAGFSDAGINISPVTTANAVVRIGEVSGIPGDGDRPSRIALGPPVPNPASGPVRFDLVPPESGSFRVEILDVAGRRVRTLVEGEGAGAQRLVWDGRDDRGIPASPGIYLARLTGSGRSLSRLLVRMP